MEKLKDLPDNSVDAICCDPPYGISFMGKKWDYDVPSQEIWEECLRVLKPGGYLLAFAGTRTQHRMAVRIEDAGFEIRDMIAWVYSTGFPKSLNIGKAVDKLQGTEYPKNTLISENSSMSGVISTRHTREIESEIAKQWEGWGTALKPALEPITVARKPLSEKSVAENVLKWGTGGINIDGSRVESNEELGRNNNARTSGTSYVVQKETMRIDNSNGKRFPANLIHDGSDEVVNCFPSDSQRFFYCAKASKAERNRGLDGLPEKRPDERTETGMGTFTEKGVAKQSNFHPTVKPLALMSYLIKLVTPPKGIVLDPFAGSGSTLVAAKELGYDFIGIELNEEYIPIIEARLKSVKKENRLF